MTHSSERAALMALVLGSALALTGCANGPSLQAVGTPDESLLEPAQNAMARAAGSSWSARAPRLMGAARMRLATARSIINEAARQNRDLTPAEKQRVNALVNALKLDVRAARAKGMLASTRTRARALERNQRGGDNAAGAGETERKALQAGMAESSAVLQPKPEAQSDKTRAQNGTSRQPRRRPPALNARPGVANGVERPLPNGNTGG